MKTLTYVRLQIFCAFVTAFVLFASFYFQYVQGLIPCPLCIMQRVCVFLLLAVLGIGFRLVSRAHIVNVLQILIAGAGLFFASRQLWLQSFPEGQAPACMPGLDILIKYFPWQTVLKTLLWGSGDCADVNWSLWGLSMSAWSALYFLFMTLMGFFLYWRIRAK